MEAADIRALRRRLGLTMAQLAEKVGVAQSDVTAWELGEKFPTKAHVQKLRALESAPAADGKPSPKLDGALWAPFLTSPEFGALLRKLLFHPELRAKAQELAAAYRDPGDG